MNKKLDKSPAASVLKPKRTSAVPGVVILALLCVILFLTLVIVLYRNDMISLPAFIENILGDDSVENTPQKNDFASAFLGSAKDAPADKNDRGELFSVDNETLTELMRGTVIPKKYYHELIVSYSGAVGSSTTAVTQKVQIYKSGEKYNIKIKSSNGAEKTVISDGVNVLIQNTLRNQMTERTLPISDSYKFSLYNEAGIPDSDHLFDLMKGIDAAAEHGETSASSEISGYEISLERTDTRNNVKINFTYNDTQISESYELSLEKGVIFSAQSSLAGAVYYTVTTAVFDETGAIDDSLFNIANKTAK
jgi:hypothetical protein